MEYAAEGVVGCIWALEVRSSWTDSLQERPYRCDRIAEPCEDCNAARRHMNTAACRRHTWRFGYKLAGGNRAAGVDIVIDHGHDVAAAGVRLR